MSALRAEANYDHLNLVEDQDNTIAFPAVHDEIDEAVSNVRDLDKRRNAKSGRSYIDSVGTAKSLSADEERELVIRAQKGDKVARNTLTLANLKLVSSIVRRYEDRGIPTADLLQEGSIGLMSAIDKFDPKMGNRFSTYATWWVREAITRSLSNKSRVVRLPVHLNELMTKIRRVRSTLALRLGRQATIEEIAVELGESVDKIEKALAASQPCMSLDQKVSNADDDSCTLGETIMDEECATPGDEVDNHYVSNQIAGLLSCLNEKERNVVKLRFGLENGQEASLREISEKLGLSRDQVGKISCLAMRKLKKVACREEFEAYIA